MDEDWKFGYKNCVKSRGETKKLNPEIYKNKALGFFESVHKK